MPKFFIDQQPKNNVISLDKDLSQHIIKSLRMKKGDEIILCDGNCHDYHCKLEEEQNGVLCAKVFKQVVCENEPNIKIHLYQALPKGNKFEQIIQKSVELGVTEITPIMTDRCVSRPNSDNFIKKLQRYKKISKSAAQQSKRGIIPLVHDIKDFKNMVSTLSHNDTNILFYECGGVSLGELYDKKIKNISIIVGSEGGFTQNEVELAKKHNIHIATLGNRILRCETAPLCILSILTFISQS